MSLNDTRQQIITYIKEKNQATVDELVMTVHAHPTLGEAVREAALEVHGGALHLPR